MRKIFFFFFFLISLLQSDDVIYSSVEQPTNSQNCSYDPPVNTLYSKVSTLDVCFNQGLNLDQYDSGVCYSNTTYIFNEVNRPDPYNDCVREITPTINYKLERVCYKATLPADEVCPIVDGVQQIVNSDTCLCETPCIIPDNAQIVNISPGECSGQMKDFEIGLSGSLAYGLCETPNCYLIESLNIGCDQYTLDVVKSLTDCNTNYNDLTFNCDDSTPNGTSTNFDCKLRQNAQFPCDNLYEEFSKDCLDQNMTINGTCKDNGMIVTYSDFECILPPPPECYSFKNEILDINTNECVCVEGYIKNQFGDCWKVLDENATQEEIDQDLEEQKKNAEDDNKQDKQEDNTKSSQDLDKKRNQILDRIAREVNATNANINDMKDQLSDDINASNGLLSDLLDVMERNISSPLDTLDQEFTNSSDWIDTIKNQYSDFYTNVTDQLSGIETKFQDTRTLFSSDYNPTISSGQTGCISFNFHGRLITFDLCTPLSQFAPIVYFVFVLIFMIATFRFLVTHLLKGIE